jgi:2-dehydropantoate 2-reductase
MASFSHPPARRIAVFGAGALGLYLGGRLARAGHAVTLIAREPQRLAPSIVIEEDGRRDVCTGLALAAPGEATAQDLLIVGLKAHQLGAAWPAIRRWQGPATQLLFLQNGLPWWYFLGEAGPFAGRQLRASDPDGVLHREVDPERSIACIVHKSVERRDARQVMATRTAGDRFVLGRPSGAADQPLNEIAALLAQAGLAAELASDLRAAVWEKLLGNVALNPVSALTGCDLAAMLGHPETRQLLRRVMEESIAVARAFGIAPQTTPDQRLQRADTVAARGPVRTSMLQDRLAGRPLEVEPIVGAVVELARLGGVATPHLDTLYACAGALSATLAGTHDTSTRKTA